MLAGTGLGGGALQAQTRGQNEVEPPREVVIAPLAIEREVVLEPLPIKPDPSVVEIAREWAAAWSDQRSPDRGPLGSVPGYS